MLVIEVSGRLVDLFHATTLQHYVGSVDGVHLQSTVRSYSKSVESTMSLTASLSTLLCGHIRGARIPKAAAKNKLVRLGRPAAPAARPLRCPCHEFSSPGFARNNPVPANDKPGAQRTSANFLPLLCQAVDLGHITDIDM